MLVEYIRRGKKEGYKGRPVGCMVAEKYNDILYVAISKYNEKKETKKFDKELAKKIAIGRLELLKENDTYKNWRDVSTLIPYSCINDFLSFIKRCEKYYKIE